MFVPREAVLCFALTAMVLQCGLQVAEAQEQPKTPKNPRCHVFESTECNTSLYPLPGFVQRGWFFHVMFNSCREYYVNQGDADCNENTNLFQTFEECNSVCGVRCKLPNGQEGLCMYKDHVPSACRSLIKPATYTRTPCHAYEVECCPAQLVLTIQGK